MIETKVRAPLERAAHLVRPRLIAEMQQAAQAQLVLVTGLAGVGKTTLVRQWVSWLSNLDGSARVAWMTVDARDNDPVRFWRYFASAVSVGCPRLTWGVGESVTAHDLDLLAEQVGLCAPMVMVLDDLHFLVDSAVLEQLDLFLGDLPEQARLVLVSRRRPPLRLARRSAAATLGHVHGSELLFTPAETGQILSATAAGPGTGAALEQRARSVHKATGGWPIAVTLSAQLAGPAPLDPLRSRQTRSRVADYLTDEVLRTLPADTTQFLLDTSVLDQITVHSCNAVRDSRDSARHIAQVEDHDAFLTPLDSDREPAWRHHAIVLDHLRRTVQEHDPERWAELHLRAARHFEKVDLDLAVDHALASGDWPFAADLVERVGERTSGTVEVARRLLWLSALPDSLVGERGKLRAFAVNLATWACRPDLAQRWIRARVADSGSDVPDLVVAGWQAALAGSMTALGEISSMGIERCTPSSEFWLSFVLGRLVSEVARGSWAAANASARLARRAARDCLPEFWSPQEYIWAEVAVTHARQGQDAAAERALVEMDTWLSRARELGYDEPGSHAARAAAMVAYHRGELEKAGVWTLLPNPAALRGGREFLLVEALLDQARVRRAVSDLDRARELLAQTRVLVERMADPASYAVWLAQEEAALAGHSPRSPATVIPFDEPRDRGLVRLSDGTVVERLSRREVEVLRMLCSEFSLPEIAQHLYLSYNTVKTHTRVIYRKLGVSGRSAAVGRGRQLGYL